MQKNDLLGLWFFEGVDFLDNGKLLVRCIFGKYTTNSVYIIYDKEVFLEPKCSGVGRQQFTGG